MSLVLNIIEKIDIVQAEIPLFCTISRLYLIPQLSTAPQLPAANGADRSAWVPRLMGVRQSAVPPCFGVLHCAIVQGFGLTLAPRSWRQGGGAGVYSGSFPVWASADSPEFPKATPPCAQSYSSLTPPAVRPSPGRAR
ncbi:hypothetical protein [Bacteroides sp. MSB163]|uniref:hypothetical protein n=1 Tax=Bacteroides maternus TaxID=3117552 RepID=UPI002EDA8A9E